MVSFGDLSVRVTAQTRDFEAGVSRAKREAATLSTRMSRVADTAEEAGDALGRTGTIAATATTGGLAAAGTASNVAALNFSALSSTVTGAVVPSLIALSTTLAPLTATLGALVAGATALAGAFGAVIGSGLIAFGKERGEQNKENLEFVEERIRVLETLQDEQGELTAKQREQLETLEERRDELEDQTGIVGGLQSAFADLREEIAPLIVEFGRQFQPLIQDAFEGIPGLVREIINSIGGLDRFAQVLRALGNQAANALPGVINGMFQLARQALPAFMDFVGFLGERGPSLIQSFMSTAKSLSDEFMGFIDAVINALPAINRFGTALLKQLLPAVSQGVTGFGNLLDEILAFTQTQQFAEIMDAVRASIRELSPEINTLVEELGVLFDRLVENGPQIIRGFTAIVDTVLDIVNAVLPVLQFFIEALGTATEFFAEWQARSERQEQRIAQGDFSGAAEQFARTTFGRGEGVSRPGRLDPDRELRVGVEVKGDTDVIEDTVVRAQMQKQREENDRVFSETGSAPGG